jgi:hypothetical protein
MKYFRRILLFFTLLAFVAALAACMPEAPTPSPSPETTATASFSVAPAPKAEEQIVAVFGAETAESFQKGVLQAAAGGAYPVEFYAGGADALPPALPDGTAAAIVYLGDASGGFAAPEFPVFVYAANGQAVAPDTPHLTYFGLNAAADALTLAVEYPPHETPVRIIGFFTSKTSGAYAVWKRACGNGRVFSKAEYIGNRSEQTAAEWFGEQLEDFYPGMIDAVFAETGALAAAAANVLAGLGRTDMEVFAASSSGGADLRLSPVLTAIVGANERQAGVLCYEGAAALLSGESVENAQIGPSVFRYSPAKS